VSTQTTVKTGQCATCGARHRLKADGTLWHHTDQRAVSNLPFKPRCDGANKDPKPDTIKEAGETTAR
jgi:hypothetical protein